jgi:hypothetical protein
MANAADQSDCASRPVYLANGVDPEIVYDELSARKTLDEWLNSPLEREKDFNVQKDALLRELGISSPTGGLSLG